MFRYKTIQILKEKMHCFRFIDSGFHFASPILGDNGYPTYCVPRHGASRSMVFIWDTYAVSVLQLILREQLGLNEGGSQILIVLKHAFRRRLIG